MRSGRRERGTDDTSPGDAASTTACGCWVAGCVARCSSAAGQRCAVGGPASSGGPAAETVDAAALSFLLAQSLAAQQQEEEEAKEQVAVAELEAQVAAAEDLLLVQLQREREEGIRVTRQTWSTLSRVEQLAVHWSLARVAVEKKKDKWKRKKKKRRRRSTVRGYSGR